MKREEFLPDNFFVNHSILDYFVFFKVDIVLRIIVCMNIYHSIKSLHKFPRVPICNG